MRDDTLDSFSANDLARACRQHLFLESVVPVATGKLNKDLFEHDDYADELVIGLVEIPDNFWHKHKALASIMKSRVASVLDFLEDDDKARVGQRLDMIP